MATKTACRRAQPRFAISRAEDAWLEFEHPAPNGRHWRLPVVDISDGGLSFVVADEYEAAAFDSGSALDTVRVQVGQCTIRGDLLIMHATPQSGSGTVCGALFYPATDSDLLKLKSLRAGLEAAANIGA